MQEINNLKVQIFDIIRQQEALQVQANQLEQVKRNLVTKLQKLEQAQSTVPLVEEPTEEEEHGKNL